MSKHRKIEIYWNQVKPESLSVRYVLDNGKIAEYKVTRRQDESIDDHLKRIGRICICAAKGVSVL